jgi:hypothetical protein
MDTIEEKPTAFYLYDVVQRKTVASFTPSSSAAQTATDEKGVAEETPAASSERPPLVFDAKSDSEQWVNAYDLVIRVAQLGKAEIRKVANLNLHGINSPDECFRAAMQLLHDDNSTFSENAMKTATSAWASYRGLYVDIWRFVCFIEKTQTYENSLLRNAQVSFKRSRQFKDVTAIYSTNTSAEMQVQIERVARLFLKLVN